MKLTDLVGDSVLRNYRIVVLGDSLTAQQGILAPAWPNLLADDLSASGLPIEVVNLAINGSTFYTAYNAVKFDTRSQVAQAVSLKPDMVIVALGFNDTVMGVGGRTVAQAKSDADLLFDTLKTALPQVKLVYASELAFDNVNCTPATALNKHVMPFAMARTSGDLLAGCATSEILGNVADSGHKLALANWVELDTYIKSNLPAGSTSITLPVWKYARLGLAGYDGLHPSATASLFCAGAVRQAFVTNITLKNALPQLSNQDYGSFNDPEVVFSGLLSASTGGYVPAVPTTTINHPVWQRGPWSSCNVVTWFMPSKGSFLTPSMAIAKYAPFFWSLKNVSPLETVYTSIDNAAFVTTNNVTDYKGEAIFNSLPDMSIGSRTFRVKVKDEIYGPFALTVSDGGGSASKAAFGKLTGLSSQSVSRAANAYTQVPMATSGAVALNGMTTGTSSLIVPRAGWYSITGTFMVAEAATTFGYGLGTVMVNGARTIEGGAQSFSSSPTMALTYLVAGYVYLAAGAIVTLSGFGINSGTFQDNDTTTPNFLIVKEMLDIL